MDPDDESQIIYTVQSRKEGLRTFDEFISEIYKGLHKLFKDDDITPNKEFFNGLSPRNKVSMMRGNITTYDEELDIPF